MGLQSEETLAIASISCPCTIPYGLNSVKIKGDWKRQFPVPDFQTAPWSPNDRNYTSVAAAQLKTQKTEDSSAKKD